MTHFGGGFGVVNHEMIRERNAEREMPDMSGLNEAEKALLSGPPVTDITDLAHLPEVMAELTSIETTEVEDAA